MVLSLFIVTGWGVLSSGRPLTWETGESGKSQGKIFLTKNLGESMKSVNQGKVREKWNCFRQISSKMWTSRILFFIFCQRIRIIWCYFWLYCWQVGVRENILSQGKGRENENLKIISNQCSNTNYFHCTPATITNHHQHHNGCWKWAHTHTTINLL